MGTHPIFESDFDCLTETMSDSDWSDSDSECSDDSENEAEVDLLAPKPIKLQSPVWDAKFHPTEPLIVSGDLDGVIKAWKFNEDTRDEPELQLEKAVHGDSIRGVAFSPSGARLFSIGTDLQLLISDVETGQPIMSLQEAFEASPYCISSTNENIIATGDEDGTVRLFDIRKKNPIDELLIDDGRCEDGINDLYQSSDGKYLLVASGDGTLSTYNCKRRMFLMESESMGSDLCSVVAVKNEQKAVVCASDGMIHLYNWTEFGHPSDMFKGHVKGDLTCCKLNEQVVLTGDVKGTIRAVNILPNRILTEVGSHQKGAPVERLDVFDERIALSVGLGSQEIRLWNLESIKPIFEGSKEARKKAKVTKNETKVNNKRSFWAGMEQGLQVELDDKVHSSDEDESDGSEKQTGGEIEQQTNEKDTETKETVAEETDTNQPTTNNIVESLVKPSGTEESTAESGTTESGTTESGTTESPMSEIGPGQKRSEKNHPSVKHKKRKKNAKPIC